MGRRILTASISVQREQYSASSLIPRSLPNGLVNIPSQVLTDIVVFGITEMMNPDEQAFIHCTQPSASLRKDTHASTQGGWGDRTTVGYYTSYVLYKTICVLTFVCAMRV